MTFSDLYGGQLDIELGTEDRTQRFTTVRRKAAANEGQRVFNEHTKCYLKRGALALVDGTGEYDVEATLTDFLWPAHTSASLKRVGASSTDYVEGPELTLVTEETLNQRDPNWRAASAGVPEFYYWRKDGGSRYLGLHVAPDVPAGETWSLLLPYVAQPADMTDDAHEPFGNSAPLITLRPYHRAVLHYAAAQMEKVRKNWDGVKRQMELFTGYVTKYHADQQPPNGATIRLAVNYRPRGRWTRPLDPYRFP